LQTLDVYLHVRFPDPEDDVLLLGVRAVHVLHELVDVNLIVLIAIDLSKDSVDVFIRDVLDTDLFE